MDNDKKLLMERLERLATVLDELMPGCAELVRDALALLKEQKSDIEKLNGFINGFSKNAIVPVRCKDCKYYDYHNGCMSWHDVNSKNDNWYCADGERKEGR